MTQVRNPDGTFGGSDKDANNTALEKLRRHDIRKQDIDRIVQALDAVNEVEKVELSMKNTIVTDTEVSGEVRHVFVLNTPEFVVFTIVGITAALLFFFGTWYLWVRT